MLQKLFDPRIFNCIMEQCRDRFVFIRSIFQGKAGNAKQMSQIRHLGTLPLLPCVYQCSVPHRLLKSLRYYGHSRKFRS